MKRLPLLFSLVVVISHVSLLPTAYAISFHTVSNSPGSTCAKVGSVAKSGTAQVKCLKNGKKLVWRKVVKAKTTPSPSASSSAKPTSVQTQTPAIPAAQSEYEINAKGTTWSWAFSYQVNGSASPRVSDSAHSTVLFLPQGKPVRINLKSNDVSHGFWIPGLGIDKEASPDSPSKIEITAEKIGTYPGACNIQCGRGHTGMKLTVEVVSEAEYLKYLSTLK